MIHKNSRGDYNYLDESALRMIGGLELKGRSGIFIVVSTAAALSGAWAIAATAGESGPTEVFAALLLGLVVPFVAVPMEKRDRVRATLLAWYAALGMWTAVAIASLVAELYATPGEAFEFTYFLATAVFYMPIGAGFAAFIASLTLPFTVRGGVPTEAALQAPEVQDGASLAPTTVAPMVSVPIQPPQRSPPTRLLPAREVDYSGGEGSAAVGILNERLARGEITIQEYREMRHAVSER